MISKFTQIFILLILACFSSAMASLSTDFFRSKNSGIWNATGTWESSSDNITWVNANLVPTTAARLITVRNAHIVSVTSNIIIDDVVVESNGVVVISSGVTLTVSDNGGVQEFIVNGILRNFNAISISGQLIFRSGSKYEHAIQTSIGRIPTATWEDGSLCEISGYTTVSNQNLAGMNQSFYDFTYNCTNQNSTFLYLGFNNGTIFRNNLTILSSGIGSIGLFPSISASITTRNYIQSGGNVYISVASGNLNSTVNVSGDFTQTGGLFSSINNNLGNLIFNGSGTVVQQFNKSGGTIGGKVNFAVNGNAIVNFGNSIISGTSGTFNLNANATLQTTNVAGITASGASGSIQNTGTRTFSTSANYVYNGTSAQQTGNGLPATVRKLTINNASGVTMRTGTITVTDSLNITGSLDMGTSALVSNNGSFGTGTIFTQNTTASPISSGRIWRGVVNYNAAGSQSIVAGTYTNLTTSTGGTKTVTGTANISNLVTVNSPSILNSNNNLTLLASATTNGNIAALSGSADVTGNVNVQSYLYGVPSGRARGTKTMSSPVNDALIGGNKTFAQLKNFMPITGPGNTGNGFDLGGNGNTNAVTLNFYNEPAVPTASAFTPVPTLTTTTRPGVGFTVFFRGNRNSMYTAPGKLNDSNGTFLPAEDVTVTYTGPINKGNIDVAIGFTNHSHVTDGYFIAGNPYPATIDWHAVQSASSNLSTTILTVTGGKPNATYNSATLASVNGGSRYIQPGQGFYVQANSGGGTLRFRENQKNVIDAPARLLSTPINQNPVLASLNGEALAIQNSSTSKAQSKLKFSLASGNLKEEALVLFDENAPKGISNEDSPYFEGYDINLATLEEENQPLAINYSPKVKRLKLLVNSLESSSMLLSFEEFPTDNVILVDHFLNTKVPINSKNKTYSFNIDKAVANSFGANRFELLFGQSILDVELAKPFALSVYPNPTRNELNIQYKHKDNLLLEASIFDLQGRKMKNISLSSNQTIKVDVNDFIKGIYMVELKSSITGDILGTTKFIKD